LSIGAFLGVSAFAAADITPKPKGPKKHRLTFVEADVDANGGLDVFEFATTQGPGTPLVQVRKRFLLIDTEGAFEPVLDPVTGEPVVDPVTGEPVQGDPIPDGLVSLEELQAYRALEEKPESTVGRFDLADFDGDGQLTAVELGYLVSPKVKARNTLRKFNRLDADDDGFISREEFQKPKEEEV
ncbi:MAG TPA: EF-hand domain-containing protein, partial [Luteolibacter sp.]